MPSPEPEPATELAQLMPEPETPPVAELAFPPAAEPGLSPKPAIETKAEPGSLGPPAAVDASEPGVGAVASGASAVDV